MFVEIANLAAPGANGANIILTQFRPLQVLDLLEGYWQVTAPLLGAAAADARGMALDQPVIGFGGVGGRAGVALPLHHIAYAYMLENTRLLDIMRRVIWEYRHGEKLPTANAPTQRWLNTTEQLFFSHPLPYSIRSMTSSLRPDPDAVRRNAYYRLLGMDLNHGAEDGRPYPYVKPEIANRDFAMVFEALLAEVWKAYANRLNIAGENTTDDNAIFQLTRRLQEMLVARRQVANLAREEFDAVAMASWFFLVVSFNTQVVFALDAVGAGIADRLRKIGERVGLAPHARADSYFQLAMPMSVILRAIEAGVIVNAPAAALLYAGGLMPQMVQLITHWSIATGRNLKDPTSRQPLGVLGATASGSIPSKTGGNGAPVNRIAGVLR